MKKTVAEIAQMINGEVDGDGLIVITGINDLQDVGVGELVFAENERWLEKAEESPAAAVITNRSAERATKTFIRVDNPKLAFGMLMHFCAPKISYKPGVHPTAVIGENVVIEDGVSVQPYAVIEDNARIGKGTVIGASCYVGHGVQVGEKCMFHPNTVIYPFCKIANRVILHAGVVVGADGFGYVEQGGKRVKIPQIGIVVIEDDVEIGANTTIDRATLGKTIIGSGTKIDNLVQIAHNDRIGSNNIFCAQSGISGSCVIGNNVIIAGQAGLADHVTVEDNVIIGAQAGVPSNKKIRGNQMVFGAPARSAKDTKRQMGAQARLPQFIDKVKELEREIEELKASLKS